MFHRTYNYKEEEEIQVSQNGFGLEVRAGSTFHFMNTFFCHFFKEKLNYENICLSNDIHNSNSISVCLAMDMAKGPTEC